ncbi:integrase [Streptomyces sp. NPDC049627]|uniref:integrase n=1 Tax=Streptomyces sp. NPDC049627 TaxID=3365595 RepID=UPI003798B528
MTREELLALPVAVDLDTANKALTIGRSTGYALAKRNEYPVTVLKLGNAYRVVTAELHRLLGIDPAELAAGSELCA